PVSGSAALGSNGITLLFSNAAYTAGDTYAFAASTGTFAVDSCVKQPTFAYAWTLQKPATSQATLSTLSGTNPQLTPDVVGTYAVQLGVTDSAGLASAPATLTLNIATCGALQPTIGSITASPTTPNAGQLTALQANNVVDGNTCGSLPVTPFIHNWSLISVPTGSSAKLSSQAAASPSLIPHLPNRLY